MEADRSFDRDVLRESLNVEPALKILVVDDHAIVRDGLVVLLTREHGLNVVGSVGTGAEAVYCARRLRPDVVIMDLLLPDFSGIEATRAILSELPAIHVIVLSACHTPDHLYRALRSGARGYVAKSSACTELVRAVNAVAAGTFFVSPGIIARPVDEKMISSIPTGLYERLSKRELEVLRAVAAGASSAEIAKRLSLSKKTVDTYRARLMSKLGVRNRSELIRFVIESQLTST